MNDICIFDWLKNYGLTRHACVHLCGRDCVIANGRIASAMIQISLLVVDPAQIANTRVFGRVDESVQRGLLLVDIGRRFREHFQSI
jgi:hypothetical protein